MLERQRYSSGNNLELQFQNLEPCYFLQGIFSTVVLFLFKWALTVLGSSLAGH